MTKTTKGGKVMNPTDAYRKELRKKELKRGFNHTVIYVLLILKVDIVALYSCWYT
ncbi:WW domain-binding protein [Trifolium medium]|uniref:WW domain-binding protein n=1 Tax=Trifolium medium TaxID=97028 RepID=A0A392QUS2_9FABA|nr:WW domain-binding protein [Trifolium medium]